MNDFLRRQARFLGFDPGGKGKFGVASANIDSDGGLTELETGCVRDAQEAIRWARDKTPFEGIGIDTLLIWSATGSRGCDRHLRERFRHHSGSVIEQNSLYSAMTVNGAILALSLSQFSKPLCEVHPKLLLKAYGSRPDFQPLISAINEVEAVSRTAKDADDRKDALVSAWAASRHYFGAWTDELFRYDLEGIQPGWKASYPWPS